MKRLAVEKDGTAEKCCSTHLADTKAETHITNMHNMAPGHLSFLKYIQVHLHPGFSPPVPVSTPRKVTFALAHKGIMSLLKHALNKSTPTTIRALQT